MKALAFHSTKMQHSRTADYCVCQHGCSLIDASFSCGEESHAKNLHSNRLYKYDEKEESFRG